MFVAGGKGFPSFKSQVCAKRLQLLLRVQCDCMVGRTVLESVLEPGNALNRMVGIHVMGL